MKRFLGKEIINTEKGSAIVATVASGLAVLAIGAGLFSEKGLDALGDWRQEVSEREAQKRALNDYRTAFKKANPYGKFALQHTELTQVAVNYREGGAGPLSWFASDTTDDYLVEIYNNCLDQTAYDRSTAIVRNPDANPNQIMVNPPDHSGKENLTFNGVISGKELTPADSQTQEILETYGCEPVEDNIVVTGRFRADLVDSSPVILETR